MDGVKNFRYYLEQLFFEEEPTTLDDEFPDKFNDWLETKDVNDILEYVDKYEEFNKLIN